MKKVKLTRDALIHTVNRVAGDVIEVDVERANRMVKDGAAEFADGSKPPEEENGEEKVLSVAENSEVNLIGTDALETDPHTGKQVRRIRPTSLRTGQPTDPLDPGRFDQQHPMKSREDVHRDTKGTVAATSATTAAPATNPADTKPDRPALNKGVGK